ncbi:MAG: ABC transporter ATP-binding protein [Lachnospiraceae bacterium]
MEEIEFRNVSFFYPGCSNPALKEINIKINRSEFIIICGKSGCGKSTLLRHLKKNLIPYGKLDGNVCYGGIDIDKLDQRVSASEIGFVSQSPENQIVTDKVWHELAFGLESLGYKNDDIKRRVAEMASFFGIQTWFHKNISELSGGQKQLLNLASIMAMQPKVLVLDEPTSQLDPIAATEFLDTLQKINRELGTTIILSEHRLEEAFPMADQVIVMDNGRVLLKDSVEKVGNFLQENENAMFQGLPVSMRVYAKVKTDLKCPVTVRDGRIWLEQLFDAGATTPAIDVPIDKKREQNTLISIKDVWYRYEKNSPDIIKGMSFDIKKGELFSIVGGNGVGKSTALKLTSGIIKPYRGSITIHGEKGSMRKKKQSMKIGVVPQNPQAVFTEITAEEELYEMLYYEKGREKEKIKKVVDMLELMELSHLSKANPYDLSGGEQQRLAIGKILLMEPELLLLDEPTKGLDPYFKSVLATILKKLQQNGVTILMVTHDIEFCAEYASRCAMMFDGALISAQNPREFFCGNSFYTTAANRMSRTVFKDAITCQDVIKLCEINMI